MRVIYVALIMASACANGNSDNVSQQSESTVGKDAAEIKQDLKRRSVYEIKPDNTYVELNTGKVVKLQYDETTQRVKEQITNREIDYFIDQTTNDTVDATGRVVNYTLIKKQDGTYVSTDEIPGQR
jgi:hypothetical protein